MTIEGNDERERVVLLRISDGLADDLLMAEMNTVEHANGESDFAVGGLKLGGEMDSPQGVR